MRAVSGYIYIYKYIYANYLSFRYITSHTPHLDFSERVISQTQRLTTHNTHETSIHTPGGFQAHNSSKRASADQRLRPRGHWARLKKQLTYSMEPVLREKLTGSQLVKKFPASYGILRFITAFTSASHLSLS